jgi:parvulin-like peptidyl-prolyl isomerase
MHYSNMRVACYIATVLFLVSACAGKDDVAPVDTDKQAFEDLRAELNTAIDDPERAEHAVRIVTVLEQDLAELRQRVTTRKQRVLALNAAYDTPRSEFDAYFEKVRLEILKSKQRAVEAREELLSYMTEEELESISRSQSKAMKSIVKSIQSI